MWVLSLWHVDFLVAACGLLVAAGEVLVAACEVLAVACMQDLVPQPGIETRPPALEAWSLTHWTTREVPLLDF